MYALVVCLDNIKRVIPVDYIQRHEDDDRITVYIPDKQRFCNAVVLQKGESKEVLQEKLQQLDAGSQASSSKRKLQSSSHPSSPSSKRVKENEKDSRCASTEEQQHVQVFDSSTSAQHQQTLNGSSPHHFGITSKKAEENSKGLHSDVNLSRVLCELLQDQRALKQQVENIEKTLQHILETLTETHAVVDSHPEVPGECAVKDEPLNEQEDTFSISTKALRPRPLLIPSYVENSESSEGESETFERLSPQNDSSVRGLSAAEQSQLETQQLPNGQSNSNPQPLEMFSSCDMNASGVKTIDLSTTSPGTQRCRLVQNDFVVIPIKFDSTNAKEEYIPPVLIRCIEYQNILLKSKTSTAFLRSLLKFFFSVETLKTHNFEGGEVNTKNGKAMRGQLNRRMVVSLIDQVEMEFPGTTRGFENMKYIKKAINDKCNHI